jgi:Fe-S cluster biogenesis protein NfuA
VAIQTEDQAINMVMENIGTLVASEGGTLELLELDASTMKVKYIAGTNEECPECVPMTDAVWQFMKVALEVHAPRITTLEVVD